MAEFCEVMRQAARMCMLNAQAGCGGCPLNMEYGCKIMHGVLEYGGIDGERPEDVERIVMDWAAKHPELRYPTWKEWQDSMFPSSDSPIAPCAFASQESLRCESNDIRTCDECRDQHIPADIAEKLGIKPVGGKEE